MAASYPTVLGSTIETSSVVGSAALQGQIAQADHLEKTAKRLEMRSTSRSPTAPHGSSRSPGSTPVITGITEEDDAEMIASGEVADSDFRIFWNPALYQAASPLFCSGLGAPNGDIRGHRGQVSFS